MNLASPKKISDVIGATSRVYMELLSINSGTFGTLGVQLSGIYGASVYQFWDI